jgi:site-specific DNA-methyltransferase (adenine-specific)
MGPQAEEAFDEAVLAGPPVLAELLKALRQVLRPSNMLAYLSMMAVRLVEMHRVLKPTGSLFLTRSIRDKRADKNYPSISRP